MVNMAGRIKSDEGTLIGNAGEYFVVAELLKRGVIAALAPRNAPAFDILATNQEKTVRIRVKTKTEAYDVWQWSVKKDGSIFRHLQSGDDFTVLVNLTNETKDMKYFILPTSVVNDWLVADFKKWLSAPGKNGRPHASDNPKRNLEFTKSADKLEPYRNKWVYCGESSSGDRIAGQYGGYSVMELSMYNSVSAQHRLQRTAAAPLATEAVCQKWIDSWK